MSIRFRVLGAAGGDNALLVEVDSGQSVERLLFDCGEGCLSGLSFADIQSLDHLFFSHLHMDHVGGFDSFFRGVFNRTAKPNRIWGPPETSRILQHRFQGFLWNLHEEMSAEWRVADIYPGQVRWARFELGEAFAAAHEEGAEAWNRTLWSGAGAVVEAITMDHRTPSMAYGVREKPRRNIDTSRLASLGLKPGPWMKQLKEAPPDSSATVIIDGVARPVRELWDLLIVETPGDSVAYLSDFLLDEAAMERLAEVLRGCGAIICESQYRSTDADLAEKNHHMTSVQAAALAQRAGARELVLFHLSDRYRPAEWLEMLAEARRIFPNTSLPPHWNLAADA